MVDASGRSIHVRGDGNIVGGRDVNIGATAFSIDQVPVDYQREFELVEQYVRSSHRAELKRAKVREFTQDLTVSGFGAVAGAVAAYLLALI